MKVFIQYALNLVKKAEQNMFQVFKDFMIVLSLLQRDWNDRLCWQCVCLGGSYRTLAVKCVLKRNLCLEPL